uniref:NADH-ubiquinone oxidoreductase chain 1 n=1 Tax=Vertigo pusilla TaxID=1282417 RepID=A0A0A6ZAF3_9EUPU|nr:NADH dehydrogenase subunit 1 [Vertigo pusilla]AGC52879.1 NADH dehydrogenase subunit 1 [Vertigo pusilla]
MYLFLMKSILVCLCVLIAVAFFTLLERKVLGYIQIRKGPNKVSIMGIAQPLADALKLFIKEKISLYKSNSMVFFLTPLLGFFIALVLWGLSPSFFSIHFNLFGLLIFFCITGLNVYITSIAGWSSNSLYAFFGGIRASAQSISYEISLVMLLIFPAIISCSMGWFQNMKDYWVFFLCFPLLFIWLVSALAETNRAPFDFAEGESELVSGFNIEYESGLFALLFLAEYTCILFMATATTVWFCKSFWVLDFIIFSFIFSLFFLVARGVYPRFRYDLLMMLCWKSYLPFAISLLMYSLFSKVF